MMPRIRRPVPAGVPQHVTQRGNDRQIVFHSGPDRLLYLQLLARHAQTLPVRLLAWCLMDNHVHLVLVPEEANALCALIGRTHRDFARWVHLRQQSSGHLWQNRFFSCPLDPAHLERALLYVERNPVRAGLVDHPWEWKWSSASAHVGGIDDSNWLDLDWWWSTHESITWREALKTGEDPALLARLREATRTGRPLGEEAFARELEVALGRPLLPGKRGPKTHAAMPAGQMRLY